jgi:hypothetical protein
VFGDDPRHGWRRDAEDPRPLGGRLTSREDALGDRGALLGCQLATSAAHPPFGSRLRLLPRRFEPGGQTIVEDDLKRRGGSAEAAAAKASMRARMASAVSLSEASEIVPGRLFLARDLVRGGEPVRVTTRVGAAW